MSILKIVEYGNPILREKSKEVTKISKKIKTLITDMLDTMYHANGVGLAAPQVGISRRIVVIDVERDEDGKKPGNPMQMVNPEIIWRSEEIVCGQEGCLSVPGQHADVERHAEVKVCYYIYEKGVESGNERGGWKFAPKFSQVRVDGMNRVYKSYGIMYKREIHG